MVPSHKAQTLSVVKKKASLAFRKVQIFARINAETFFTFLLKNTSREEKDLTSEIGTNLAKNFQSKKQDV